MGTADGKDRSVSGSDRVKTWAAWVLLSLPLVSVTSRFAIDHGNECEPLKFPVPVTVSV